MNGASNPKPSFLSSFASRLATARAGGGRGVPGAAPEPGLGAEPVPGGELISNLDNVRTFKVPRFAAANRAYRPAAPASGRRAAGPCACDGRRTVPVLRKGR